MPENLRVLGLVGEPCSGKDTVAAYLVEAYGFRHVSTGDLVRFYIAEHELGEPTRPLLQQVANRIREEHGADYLVRLAMEDRSSRLVISGLRALPEVSAVKETGEVWSVIAPIELRFTRMQARGRVSDHITFEQFKEQEERENANPSSTSQNVSGAMRLANRSISNGGDLEDLQDQVDRILAEAL